MDQTCEFAVEVKNAYKTYPQTFPVLNGFNMEVSKGSMWVYFYYFIRILIVVFKQQTGVFYRN